MRTSLICSLRKNGRVRDVQCQLQLCTGSLDADLKAKRDIVDRDSHAVRAARHNMYKQGGVTYIMEHGSL